MFALLLTVVASPGVRPQTVAPRLPEVKITISAEKATYSVGEPIRVRYQVENVGTEPFYIPQGIDSIGNATGCVILEVHAEGKGAGVLEKSTLDHNSEYWENRDIRAEIRTKWLLLAPGHFYGTSAEAPFTTSQPGTYVITAEHLSGYLSEREKLLVANMDHPLLTGSHTSQPIRVKVVNRPIKALHER